MKQSAQVHAGAAIGISLAAAALTALTGALCPPPTLGETLSAQLPAVRGYMLRGGLLSLSLLAVGGVRYRNDPDPALEAAILRNVSGYTRSVVGDTPERWGRYVHAASDLDGDGRDEVFVYLMGSPFCGTGGCTLQVYRLTPGGYVLVNDFPISRLPVVAADTRHNGWRDLWRLESGGGAPATYVRHVYNGERYEERGRIPAELGMPKGLAVLSGNPTHAEGIVLKPAD